MASATLLLFVIIIYKNCFAQKWSKMQGVFAALGGMYFFLVLLFTVVLRTPYKGVHLKLIPLWRLMKTDRYDFYYVIKEILINISLLLPLGFFFHAGFPKAKTGKIIVIGFTLSLIIEILQFISQRGAFEMDDLIFNTIGLYLGFILGRLVLYQKKCVQGNNW